MTHPVTEHAGLGFTRSLKSGSAPQSNGGVYFRFVSNNTFVVANIRITLSDRSSMRHETFECL